MSPKISSSITTRHLVAVPYPGRGHVNPLMNFCKLLCTKDFDQDLLQVTFILTEEWLGFIGAEDKPENVRFEAIPDVIPSELVRGADMQGFIEAVLTKMEEPVERVLDRLEPPVSVIVADSFLNWMGGVGNRRNIPVASFWPMSAMTFSILYHSHLFRSSRQYPVDVSGEDHCIDTIPGIPSIRLVDLPDVFHPNHEYLFNKITETISTMTSNAQSLIFRSIYELEAPVFDALKKEIPMNIYAIGPAIPYFNFQGKSVPIITNNHVKDERSYIRWLNSQLENSVLYVSLGSFISVSSAQMDEILTGLRDSGVPYLWVARGEASRLKDGGGENGLIVPWCDQLSVLSHKSVGGFMTHCGMNSTLESAFCGVPVLTFPLAVDQYPNSKLLVEDWQVGWRLKTNVGNEHLVKGVEIAGIVKRFMNLEREERKILEAKSKQLQSTSQEAIGKGGSAYTNLDAFFKKYFALV
ncbi:hypothetical protein Ancab_019861 [Ancistrocladus abbreviatus]